jgi:small subunit ribosomal protein S7
MRKTRAKKRFITPDPQFNDVVVAKFVNNLMLHGKKSVAFKIFYDAMEIITTKSEETPSIEVFKKALENVTPGVEVKSRRVGGATFQIPSPVRESRKNSLAMKWLIGYSRKRNEKSMAQKLANKAFSHFRF